MDNAQKKFKNGTTFYKSDNLSKRYKQQIEWQSGFEIIFVKTAQHCITCVLNLYAIHMHKHKYTNNGVLVVGYF